MEIPVRNFKTCTEKRLAHVIARTGILLVRGAVPTSIARYAYAAAANAFASCAHLAHQPFDRLTHTGYTPQSRERTVRGVNVSMRHSFDYRPGVSTIMSRGEYSERYEHDMRRCYQAVSQATLGLLRLFRTVTKEPIDPILTGGRFVLRLAESLNVRPEPKTEVFPPHRDFGLFTVFVGGADPGLQVHLGGEWVDVTPGMGEILIAPGMLFKGYFPSAVVPLHRVTGAVAKRVSLTLFVDPRSGVLLPTGELVEAYYTRMYNAVRQKAA